MLALSASPAALVLAKATALLVLAFVATRVMSRVSAVVRHTVWMVAMAALLLIPAVSAFAPFRLPILPPALSALSALPVRDATEGTTTTGDAAVAAPALQALVNDNDRLRRETDDARATGATSAPIAAAPEGRGSDVGAVGDWTWSRAVSTLLAVWLAIAVVLMLWLLAGWFTVRGIVRRATRVDEAAWTGALYDLADRIGLAHAPTVWRSSEITMPFASGYRHPLIVLPTESAAWTADERTAVLLHELAHIKRRDIVAHTLSRITCALYWFHPLVWTAARRLRAESEQECDDLALLSGA